MIDKVTLRREFFTGALLAAAHTALSVAVVLLTLASYALWGSASSPLGGLWKLALGALILWQVSLRVHMVMRTRCQRAYEIDLRSWKSRKNRA